MKTTTPISLLICLCLLLAVTFAADNDEPKRRRRTTLFRVQDTLESSSQQPMFTSPQVRGRRREFGEVAEREAELLNWNDEEWGRLLADEMSLSYPASSMSGRMQMKMTMQMMMGSTMGSKKSGGMGGMGKRSKDKSAGGKGMKMISSGSTKKGMGTYEMADSARSMMGKISKSGGMGKSAGMGKSSMGGSGMGMGGKSAGMGKGYKSSMGMGGGGKSDKKSMSGMAMGAMGGMSMYSYYYDDDYMPMMSSGMSRPGMGLMMGAYSDDRPEKSGMKPMREGMAMGMVESMGMMGGGMSADGPYDYSYEDDDYYGKGGMMGGAMGGGKGSSGGKGISGGMAPRSSMSMFDKKNSYWRD